MKAVIDTMKEKDMRDDCVVLVGGAPLNEEHNQLTKGKANPLSTK